MNRRNSVRKNRRMSRLSTGKRSSGAGKMAVPPAPLNKDQSIMSMGSTGSLDLLQAAQFKDYFSTGDFRSRMWHLTHLRHPNVVSVLGVNNTATNTMIVMEYLIRRSLFEVLHVEQVVFEQDSLMGILSDVASGMAFLHGHNPMIIHGHLCSMNILLDSNYGAKITDFLGMSETEVYIRHDDPCAAPEAKDGLLLPASDVFSFSVVMSECFTRQNPRLSAREQRLESLLEVPESTPGSSPTASAIQTRQPSGGSSLAVDIPPALGICITSCRHNDAEKRPTFAEVLKTLQAQGHTSVGEAFMRRGREGRQQDRVLQQVFPKHIAEALKNDIKPEIEEISMVSVFFLDIVSFTTLSDQIGPMAVSTMLDRFFSKIDNLISEMDLYKVDVIGDCVIVAGNLYRSQSDFVSRLCQFSLCALEAAASTPILQHDPDKHGMVRIRCGIDAGPVCANVIGRLSPKYTLLGDTMNTASRMESSSVPGYTQLTGRAAMLLKQQDPDMFRRLKVRGEIDVKGKGKLTTYWLLADHQKPPVVKPDQVPSTAAKILPKSLAVDDDLQPLRSKNSSPRPSLDGSMSSPSEHSLGRTRSPERQPRRPFLSRLLGRGQDSEAPSARATSADTLDLEARAGMDESRRSSAIRGDELLKRQSFEFDQVRPHSPAKERASSTRNFRRVSNDSSVAGTHVKSSLSPLASSSASRRESAELSGYAMVKGDSPQHRPASTSPLRNAQGSVRRNSSTYNVARETAIHPGDERTARPDLPAPSPERLSRALSYEMLKQHKQLHEAMSSHSSSRRASDTIQEPSGSTFLGSFHNTAPANVGASDPTMTQRPLIPSAPRRSSQTVTLQDGQQLTVATLL
eukprot:TRINITY_DN10953_c0_g1_i1.p1 TRINITY_DN10953_c0_g1~~TRINITY_DN10953_c0_g1_i1.p1  ORF type:complete len:855 (+),score=191.73 TRINITY_DN10953_c0_g1_i1:232-2796(+)